MLVQISKMTNYIIYENKFQNLKHKIMIFYYIYSLIQKMSTNK